MADPEKDHNHDFTEEPTPFLQAIVLNDETLRPSNIQHSDDRTRTQVPVTTRLPETSRFTYGVEDADLGAVVGSVSVFADMPAFGHAMTHLVHDRPPVLQSNLVDSGLSFGGFSGCESNDIQVDGNETDEEIQPERRAEKSTSVVSTRQRGGSAAGLNDKDARTSTADSSSKAEGAKGFANIEISVATPLTSISDSGLPNEIFTESIVENDPGHAAAGTTGLAAAGTTGLAAGGTTGLTAGGTRLAAAFTTRHAAAGTTGLAAAGTKGLAAAGTTGLAAAGTKGLAATGTTSLAAAGTTGLAAAGTTGLAAAGTTGLADVATTGPPNEVPAEVPAVQPIVRRRQYIAQETNSNDHDINLLAEALHGTNPPYPLSSDIALHPEHPDSVQVDIDLRAEKRKSAAERREHAHINLPNPTIWTCATCFQRPKQTINFPCMCLCNCLQCSEYADVCVICQAYIEAVIPIHDPV